MALNKLEKELLDMLIEAQSHLEYCNYGDKWEKECAVEAKLPERLQAVITAAEEQAEA